MGWSFPWISSFATDFNYDYHVSYTPAQLAGEGLVNYRVAKPLRSDTVGISVFVKDVDGRLYHSYSTYTRGVDMMNAAYNYLDLTPKGRDEANQEPRPQAWVRRHDKYEDGE